VCIHILVGLGEGGKLFRQKVNEQALRFAKIHSPVMIIVMIHGPWQIFDIVMLKVDYIFVVNLFRV
jgi:hypothetical protein